MGFLELRVEHMTFKYPLIRAEPEGINPKDVLLEFNFVNVVDPNGKGTATIHYIEEMSAPDTFNTLTIISIASVEVVLE